MMVMKSRPRVSFSTTDLKLSVVVAVAVLLSLCLVTVSAKGKLRIDRNGNFKILQVADMHYADGKVTPCEDVLPKQVHGCSDLNTTAFLRRMIDAEKPHLIVFTGTFLSFHFTHLGLFCCY